MTTTEPQPGEARSAGPSIQDLLDADSRPVPAALRDHSADYQGSADVPKARYTDPAFAELEREFLWTKTWQMACHASLLADPGDHVVYDVADESLIVTRTKGGEIKAYHNSCLHRGTKLRVDDGRVGSFRCPFHGWRWDLDGNLVELPAQWDFPHIWEDPMAQCLPEAEVAEWGGFVFVNLDPDCRPFEEVAARLIEHLDEFDFGDRIVGFHAVKEVEANWKVVMEAFSEGYHVIATHPQILEFTADENSEYSIWPGDDHVTRFVNGFGLASPHLGDKLSEQDVFDAYMKFRGSERGVEDEAPLPEGIAARQAVAENFRTGLSSMFGADLSERSDSEVLDAILYHLFPAFAPWAGVGQPLVYRWRPGATPDTCFMDVYRMVPPPDDGPTPDPAPTTHLTLEQRWKEAPRMAGLADVFEQDMANLPRVQAGLKSTAKPTVSFSNYQEARLRKFHRVIDAYVDAGLQAAGRDTAELDPYRVPEG